MSTKGQGKQHLIPSARPSARPTVGKLSGRKTELMKGTTGTSFLNSTNNHKRSHAPWEGDAAAMRESGVYIKRPPSGGASLAGSSGEDSTEGDETPSMGVSPAPSAPLPVDPDAHLSPKDRFRKYATTSGAKAGIIRALVALFEEKDDEKPDDPMAWILGLWGHGLPHTADIEKVQAEAKELRDKVVQLQEEQAELRRQVEEKEGRELEEHEKIQKDLQRMIDELTEQGEFAPPPPPPEEEDECACIF